MMPNDLAKLIATLLQETEDLNSAVEAENLQTALLDTIQKRRIRLLAAIEKAFTLDSNAELLKAPELQRQLRMAQQLENETITKLQQRQHSLQSEYGSMSKRNKVSQAYKQFK